MKNSPNILVAMRPALYEELFSAELDDRLRALGEVTVLRAAGRLRSEQLAEQISGRDVVISGWGTPQFNETVMRAADRLQLIAHSAGSIKFMLPPPVFDHGARVTHVAAAMAIAVAETTLLFILLSLRQFPKIERAFRDESWDAGRLIPLGGELAALRVGVIGAGYTGRAVIRRLHALDAELWVFDPYLSEAEAISLGLKKVDLETLMRACPVVTLQAPATKATYKMIGAEQLSWLQDGAIFVNTARAHLVDEAALVTELQTGRISAALDVYEQEPLPRDNPLLQLDNVIMTPHFAARTRQARQRQADFTVEEVERFLRDGSLRFEVTRAMLETMA